jgi:IS5 family transposase
MKQLTLATTGFEKFSKTTKREVFLAEMNQVVPWVALCALIEPYYPKAGNGRPPIGLERMLRIHFLQHWFNLADPVVEEALYDSNALRRFAGIDLGREPVPDETTICKFRHLLEHHHLGDQLFAAINQHLQASGLTVSTGTIVDATIIRAPSSTKNQAGQRDPDMKQTRKGQQYYFGMKAHIGCDSQTKLIHHVAATPANVHDSRVLPELLHGRERRVYGDSAYTGQGEVIAHMAPKAKDFTQARARRNGPLTDQQRSRNRHKSKIRARVEHAIGVLKHIFGFTKVRYRGLMKNAHRLFTLAGLANLYMARTFLLKRQA